MREWRIGRAVVRRGAEQVSVLFHVSNNREKRRRKKEKEKEKKISHCDVVLLVSNMAPGIFLKPR